MVEIKDYFHKLAAAAESDTSKPAKKYRFFTSPEDIKDQIINCIIVARSQIGALVAYLDMTDEYDYFQYLYGLSVDGDSIPRFIKMVFYENGNYCDELMITEFNEILVRPECFCKRKGEDFKN